MRVVRGGEGTGGMSLGGGSRYGYEGSPGTDGDEHRVEEKH